MKFSKVTKEKEMVFIEMKEKETLNKFTLYAPAESKRCFVWLDKTTSVETATAILLENYKLKKMGL